MKSVILHIISLIVLCSCSSQTTDISQAEQSKQLEVAGSTADFLQMTQDDKGNTLAWWIEKDQHSGESIICFSKSPFSKSSSADLSFDKARCIAASRGVNPAHGEGLPKLVVKPDGTYVLVFGRPNNNSSARFASSVLYVQSFNEGENWTEPKLIHSDTNPDNSHAFPTAILLPNGEVGAVWLDGRHHLEHSELYFARTEGRNGFGRDKRIGGPGCQCCKLYMYVDDNQMLHLVYRGLTKDNIRDIMHITSDDDGQNFSSPALVSRDNWQIMACPHNGPSITQTDNSLLAAWYTMGGEEGLYYARSSDGGQTFSPRNRLAQRAKHPYIASLDDAAIAVWDEVFRESDQVYQRVKMSRISDEGVVVETRYLSPAGIEASMPYLMEMDGGDVLAGWTQ
ncbi:MAG TPA: sialidase family protein, partial [Fodinibius sp.]|nr:sialidase family protein [Fodinibius sp.]